MKDSQDFKAPRPDGLHVVFYEQFWDVCGAEITHVHEVLLALNSGVIPRVGMIHLP
jgi:hypothetical protein